MLICSHRGVTLGSRWWELVSLWVVLVLLGWLRWISQISPTERYPFPFVNNNQSAELHGPGVICGYQTPVQRAELAWAQSIKILFSPLWPDFGGLQGAPCFCRLVSR